MKICFRFVAWGDFETCANDCECAKSCARYFQSQNGQDCLNRKQQALQDWTITTLDCEDYARMHFWGASMACDRNDAVRGEMVQYLRNLTMKCGTDSKFSSTLLFFMLFFNVQTC